MATRRERSEDVEAERLVQAAEAVLSVLKDLGREGAKPLVLDPMNRPEALREFTNSEVVEATAFLRRLGVVTVTGGR